MKKRIILSGVMILTSIFITLSGCGKKADTTSVSGKLAVTSAADSGAAGVASTTSIIAEDTEKPKKPAYVSPLSGKALDKKYKHKRPFAFMFNNIEFAYPQTGTGRADILYEILAEGGITRLMGVFDYMKGDRIVSATCYLPLSANMSLSKELGTRHRAAVGVSEVTDSLTIVVSEETGKVSLAKDGKLIRNVDGGKLKSELVKFQKLDPFANETKLKWQKVKKHLFRNRQDGDD